jgi:acyl dehydratase
MAIDYQALMNRKFEDVVSTYDAKDTMLYALGVGVGSDEPIISEQDLQYIYEEELVALPTMSVVLGHPGFWLKEPDVGIKWLKVLHVGHNIEMHRPLSASGTVRSECRISEIIDLGKKKGALVTWLRDLYDEENGELICSISQTGLARADGGFGGPGKSATETEESFDYASRIADVSIDLQTTVQAALIYRLSGDYNPLHAAPEAAKKAGFERPILHGLCTYAIAGRAVLKGYCDGDASRLKSMQVRFSAPVYPGETIRTEMWTGVRGKIYFRCRSVERDVLVLKEGFAQIN